MTRQYSVKQIAEDLGVSTQHVRSYLKKGKINGKKVGSYWAITREEREKLLHRRKRRLARRAVLAQRRIEEDSGEIQQVNTWKDLSQS